VSRLRLTPQLGHTVLFTLVHAGKYRTEDKLKIQRIYKLNTTQKKTNNTKQQKETTLVWSPFTTLGQEMRWAYSTTLPSPDGPRMDTVGSF